MVRRLDDIAPDGVRVVIPWSELHVGGSFFVPCINVAQAQREVGVIADRLGYTLICRTRTEDKVLGLRIWRTA